jgi:23S rRNA (cytosine1962-C5)-methyltransferase
MTKETEFDYELIDCGDSSRVERFGKIIVDRPCPQATWASKVTDFEYDVFFERNEKETKWDGAENFAEFWEIQVGKNVRAELRFSKNGQVGIFPEQLDNWNWIQEKVLLNSPLRKGTGEISENPAKKILNTFAYTGMATLFASTENTEVVHVDGAKSAINWAKRNAEISGKSENKIRWIHDDVLSFIAREVRRGNKYDGIILDPPAFGRGKKGDWKISRDLPKLMEMVAQILTEKPLFVILTCHAPEHFSSKDFAEILENLPQFSGQKAELLTLEIPAKNGNSLPSSFGARICS